jgi:hypothetical protein
MRHIIVVYVFDLPDVCIFLAQAELIVEKLTFNLGLGNRSFSD